MADSPELGPALPAGYFREVTPGRIPVFVYELLRDYLEQSYSDNTLRAYASDWRRFAQWCEQYGRDALPTDAETLALYISEAAGLQGAAPGKWQYSPPTLSRWIAGIDSVHRVHGEMPPGSHPGVKQLMKGIRRSRKHRADQKEPLLMADLRQLLDALPHRGWPGEVRGRRDRCLILLEYSIARRRSEMSALDVGDARLHRVDGLHVRIAGSKTDQEAKGKNKAAPYGSFPQTCPPCAYIRWREILDAADIGGIRAIEDVVRYSDTSIHEHVCSNPRVLDDSELADDRPLFRRVNRHGHIERERLGPHGVNSIVKRAVRDAGMPKVLYASHSLRAGFVTQSFRNGETMHSIMRQTDHKSPTVLEDYARESAPLQNNAVNTLGL